MWNIAVILMLSLGLSPAKIEGKNIVKRIYVLEAVFEYLYI